MPRPNEIAADAHALYGPAAVRPAAGAMGDGALWVDPGNNQALYQVQSGNWVRIALPPADDDSSTPPLFDTRVDSFRRRDQDSWGTASDGHIWSAVGGANSATVLAGSGRQPVLNDVMLLAPDLAADDVEVLVRWRVIGGLGVDGPQLFLRMSADGSAESVALIPYLDGHYEIDLNSAGETPAYDSSAGTWGGASGGDALWTRFRAVGTTYAWRTWADGVAEPAAWDATKTSALGHGRQVGLAAALSTPDSSIAFDQFSATTL